MSWNIVLNEIKEIKKIFLSITQQVDEESIYNSETVCLLDWIKAIKESKDQNIAKKGEEYEKLFSPVKMNQYKHFIILKYDLLRLWNVVPMTPQEFWNYHNGFYRECRGLVIDLKNECLVLTPFRKFFNIGELEECSLETVKEKIKTAEIVEVTNKLDGSLCSIRYYNNEFVVASSGVINPEESKYIQEMTKFLKNNGNIQTMIRAYPDYTFIFEYISKMDPHVVSYDTEGLFLIGVRSTLDGQELSYGRISKMAEFFNVTMTDIENKGLEDILLETAKYASNEKEGWVINIDGQKYKLKCDDYLNIHNFLSGMAQNNIIIQAMAEGTIDDLCAIPKINKKNLEEVQEKVYEYIGLMNGLIKKYYEVAPSKDKKEFMLYVDTIPKFLQGYVRNYYLGYKNEFLKKICGYLRYTELIENLKILEEIAREENNNFVK